MKHNITKDQIAAIFRGTPQKYIDHYTQPLIEYMDKYGIDTTRRQAMFLAQLKHESGGLRFVSENLNYSSNALLRVFGKYFNRTTAQQYARNPQGIANIVYANRMGNGSTASGEGWKYRGRGLIQLTGKNNYTRFKADTGIDVINNPDYLTTAEGAVHSAVWFWKKNSLNKYADVMDIRGSTKRINGGYNGLKDRIHNFNVAIKILGLDDDKSVVKTARVRYYKVGSSGVVVKKIQEKVGATVDGQFGPGTEKAVKSWQAKNGLTPDGVVGPATLEEMQI